MKLLKYAAIAGAGYWLFKTYGKAKNIYNNVTAKVINVEKIRPSIKEINFSMDILLANPTDEPLNINTYGAATLSEVIFYDPQGVFFGTARININSLSIPAQGSQIITDIPATMPTDKVLALLPNIQNLKNFTTKLKFTTAGQTLIV